MSPPQLTMVIAGAEYVLLVMSLRLDRLIVTHPEADTERVGCRRVDDVGGDDDRILVAVEQVRLKRVTD